MVETVDAGTDRDRAVTAAARALRAGELVVVPTDTVYGVAADAFNPVGTAAVFTAKQRDRSAPLPVLVRSPKQLTGLVTTVDERAERLMAAWWPGPLTIVVRSEPNLAWDLGDNEGTVAVRMPFDDVTLAVIREVGPLAVTSANLSGSPAATTVGEAREQLGDAVAVYVDDGPRADTTPSTIVDLTRTRPAVLRPGPLDPDEVIAVADGDLPSHEATPWSPPEGDDDSGELPDDEVDHVVSDHRTDDGAAEAGDVVADDRPSTRDVDRAQAPSSDTVDEHAGDQSRPGRHVARDHRKR